MNEQKLQNLIKECKQIENDSLYTAEVHYIIGNKLKIKSIRFKFIPALIAAVAAFFLLVGAPNWVSWITLLGALVTIISLLLEPEKEANNHFSAAQNFTVLKHEARSLYEVFRDFIDEKDFYHEVKILREKYNLFAKLTSPTDDEKAWNQARENIKSGRHKADFREKKDQEIG